MTTHDIPNRRRSSRAAFAVGASVAVGLAVCVGLLLSDDLSMKALRGTIAELAQRSVAAGCDIALHCNGKMEEMAQVAAGAPPLSKAALERYTRGRRQVGKGQMVKADQVATELNALLA